MMKRCPRLFSGVRVTEPFLVNGLIFLAPPLMKIINCELHSNIVLIRVEQNEFLTFTNLSSAFAFCISTEFRISALEISAQKKSAVVNNELEISELL